MVLLPKSLCNVNPKKNTQKKKTAKKNGHKEYWDEVQGPWEPKMTRDTKSHQLLDEVSQTYFYQKVWWKYQHSDVW